jgi:hypothetical protein
MGSALNRDCVMPPHSIRFELSLLSLQLALSPMRVFAIRIERPFDLSIQCSHAIVCLDRDEKFAGRSTSRWTQTMISASQPPAAGATGTRHSPRPLWADELNNASGASRRDCMPNSQ